MPDDRLNQIKNDMAYFKKAHSLMGVGGQPPTVYADKYVADLAYLLALIPGEVVVVADPLPLSPLEQALADDAAGRVERQNVE